VELKRSWVDPSESEVLQRENPEVLAYCRWWHDVHEDDDGICVLTRKGLHPEQPEVAVDVRLVPVTWRLDVWRAVHVKSCSHLGFERVYHIIQGHFIWPSMADDVWLMCRACLVCQQSKPGRRGARYRLSHEYVTRTHQRVGMNLQGPLEPTSRGNRYICVIQDYFSKRMEFNLLR
jgi:hypothetical protein